MKVLYALSKYPQLSETYVTAEIAFMLRADVDVRVWTPFVRIPDVRPQTIVYADSLSEAVRAFKPDIVHVHHLDVGLSYHKQLEGANVPITVRGHSFDFAVETVQRLTSFPRIEKVYLFPHHARLVKSQKVFALPVAYDSTRYKPTIEKNRNMVLRLGAGLATKALGDFYAIAKLCPSFKFVAGLATCDDQARVANALLTQNAKSTVTLFKDVSWEAAEGLTKQAGIFLHTYDQAAHPFGMPISIAEALAAGSTVLIRDTMAAREFAGDAAFYYRTTEEAAEIINSTKTWTPDIFDRQYDRAVMQGSLYADSAVLPHLLHDWQSISSRRR